MSKFTTEVRFICETANGLTESQGFTSIQNILSTAAPTVFDFDFPIFDENYRLPLEIKILRHYYTREICEETVGLWKLRLADRLNMIMPYYNKLYESELLKFNPFYDVDLTTIHKKDFNGNEDTRRDGTGSEYGIDSKDKRSSINGEVVEGVKLTNISHDESENKDDISKNGNRNTDTKTAAVNTRTNNETIKANETHDDTNIGSTNAINNSNNTSSESHDDTTIGSVENNGSNSSITNTNNETVNIDTSDKWDLYSDTPQGGIDGIENATSGIAGLGYLTNARNNKDESLNKSNGNGNTTASGEEKKNEESFSKNDGSKSTTNTQNENNTEENFSKTDGSKNSISTTSGEVTDEGIGTNKVVDSNAENENRIGTSEKSGFSKADKETIGNNNSTTIDNVEGFNSVKRESKDNQTVDINNTEEYVEHIVGKQGIRSYSKMLEEFRSTFLNIDKMIIDELSDLFFGLWE